MGRRGRRNAPARESVHSHRGNRPAYKAGLAPLPSVLPSMARGTMGARILTDRNNGKGRTLAARPRHSPCSVDRVSRASPGATLERGVRPGTF